MAKPFTRAVEMTEPGFRYSGGTGADQLYFHLSFFAKFSSSENPGPVFVSLRWLPQDQTWALSRMLADKWLNLRTMF